MISQLQKNSNKVLDIACEIKTLFDMPLMVDQNQKMLRTS